MNVLLLSATPLRGAAQRVAAMLQRHTALGVRVATFCDWDGGRSKPFPPAAETTPCWWQPELAIHNAANPAVLADCARWADVYHFFHRTSPRSFPDPGAFAPAKPRALQVFGGWTRALQNAWDPAKARFDRVAFVAEGWHRYAPPATAFKILPMLYDIYHPLLCPAPWSTRRQRRQISWGFPRPARANDSADKQYDYGAARLEALFAAAPRDSFSHVRFDHALRRRAAGWVGIDELESPMIHNTTWEYACLGVPCLKRFDEATLDALQAVTGRRDPPFIGATYDTVREEARRALAADEAEWRARCEATRAWVVEHYHPREMAKQYVAFYEEAAR